MLGHTGPISELTLPDLGLLVARLFGHITITPQTLAQLLEEEFQGGYENTDY